MLWYAPSIGWIHREQPENSIRIFLSFNIFLENIQRGHLSWSIRCWQSIAEPTSTHFLTKTTHTHTLRVETMARALSRENPSIHSFSSTQKQPKTWCSAQVLDVHRKIPPETQTQNCIICCCYYYDTLLYDSNNKIAPDASVSTSFIYTFIDRCSMVKFSDLPRHSSGLVVALAQRIQLFLQVQRIYWNITQQCMFRYCAGGLSGRHISHKIFIKIAKIKSRS